jgi:hypothetical protein
VLNDAAAVTARVLELHENQKELRPVVEVYRADEPAFTIAVGGPETVLTFNQTVHGPYFISLGAPHRDGDSPLFCHGKQGIDHPAKNLVSWDKGLKALADFLESLQRAKSISWEQL